MILIGPPHSGHLVTSSEAIKTNGHHRSGRMGDKPSESRVGPESAVVPAEFALDRLDWKRTKEHLQTSLTANPHPCQSHE